MAPTGSGRASISSKTAGSIPGRNAPAVPLRHWPRGWDTTTTKRARLLDRIEHGGDPLVIRALLHERHELALGRVGALPELLRQPLYLALVLTQIVRGREHGRVLVDDGLHGGGRLGKGNLSSEPGPGFT